MLPKTEVLYDELEMALRAKGASDFVYDEEHDLLCFPENGRFAFS
jgi:hypothetical protein